MELFFFIISFCHLCSISTVFIIVKPIFLSVFLKFKSNEIINYEKEKYVEI